MSDERPSKRQRVGDGEEEEDDHVKSEHVDNDNDNQDGSEKGPGLERRIRAGAARYHCNYCQRDITNLFRIKCAECPDFDLCLECFSVGVEVFPHKNNHNYRIMDNLTFPLYDPAWGADEELLLLEAVQMCGLGNWVDVQEHVGTKTKQECEEHYFATYINTPTIPLPDPAKFVDPYGVEYHGPSQRLKSERVEQSAVVQETRSLVSNPKGARAAAATVAGYMPLRNDFESEYDNDAEMIIADMEVLPSDSPEDKELKTKLLLIYDAKLEERRRRKQFVLERGLLDFKKLYSQERRKPKEERELTQRLRVFAQYQTQEEHAQLIQGLMRERELRRRIAMLQNYRQNGIRTLREAEAYDINKKKFEEEVKRANEDSAYARSALPRSSRFAGRDRALQGAFSSPAGKSVRKGAQLDIAGCEGVELLSEDEKQLCSVLRIVPRQYMLIKDVLIRESERVGFLPLSAASQMLKIDVTKTGKLYEFFVQNAWITPSNSACAASPSSASSPAPLDPAPNP